MTTVSFMYRAVSFAPSRDISFKRVPVGITVFPYWIAISNGAVSVINCSTRPGVVEGGQGEVSGLLRRQSLVAGSLKAMLVFFREFRL